MRAVLIYLFLVFSVSSIFAQDENPPWFLIDLEHDGPEDFVYDGVYNRLIIASGNRDKKHPEKAYGVFQTLDLSDHSVKTLGQDGDLKEWISLGIKAAPFDTTFQYMTIATKEHENMGRIQGLLISKDSVQLISKTIVLGDFTSNINNIRWVDGRGLYITNLYKAKTMFGAAFSNLKGEVYRANYFGEKAEVVSKAHGPNSIGVMDSTVYLTGTRERFLLEITDEDKVEKVKTVPIIGGDNVTVQGNKLYTTGSPKLPEVLKYMNGKREIAGSLIYEMTNENGALRCSRIIVVDPSIGMGMISVVYKHENAFYCGQIRSPKLLYITDDDSCLTKIATPKRNKYTRKIYGQYKRLFRKKGIPLPEFVVLKSE